MEMDYYSDPDSDFEEGYDDEWLYVEDYIAPSDVLAENQVPEPGYCGTNYEIALHGYELDVYDYWMDLKYGNDAYWENETSQSATKNTATSSQKRKRRTDGQKVSQGKRRRANVQTSTSSDIPGTELIVFWNMQERISRFLAPPPMLTKSVPFALLPDWKKDLVDDEWPVSVNPMPKDMQLAAESADPESGSESEIEGSDEGAMDLDPDMLKTVLRQRLGEAGLEGMDEGMFMQIISQMVSGEGNAEDATDDLTRDLLGKITGNNHDENLSGWLSQQGVTLQDENDDSGADSDALKEASIPSGSRTTEVSTVADGVDGVEHVSGGAREPSASSKGSLGAPARTNKRKARSNVEDGNKRTKVVSDTTSEDAHRRDSKAVQDTEESHHEKLASADHRSGIEADTADGSPLTSDSQPAHSQRKRKAVDVDDTKAAQAKERKRTKQEDEVTVEPQPESTPVARRTRNAKGKSKQ